LFTSLFWKDFAERLIATLAQVASGLLTADAAASVPAEVWLITLSVSGLAVLVKALAANGISGTVSPASFMPASPDRPAADKEDVADGTAQEAEVESGFSEPVGVIRE